MIKAVVFCVAALWAGAACAADQPVYDAAPNWVKPGVIPAATATANADGAPVQVLMFDNQAHYGAEGDQFYREYAAKILAPQGLSVAGSITQSWNPDTDTLHIHRVDIIRGGKVIDVLANGQKFIVLRRENQLELAMLDGTLTATIQPEGLEVGDVVDVAVTIEKHDPVLNGISESLSAMRFPGVVGRIRVRDIWPNDKPIRWRVTDGLGTPTVTHTAGETEMTLDLTNVRVPKPPLGAPTRFNNLAEIEVSQFADWGQISSLMAPLYAKAATLGPDSRVKAEVDKIAAATTDPKERAALALHLVQDKTRYVFLGMNFGGYIPAEADRTWARRFGDCKGKTALLLAMLHALGIKAEPALISTTQGDGLDERLPLLSVFDHVMVRAEIGGKVYWLDGTREGDRGLDDLTIPNFHWALPVKASGGKLEKLEPAQLLTPETESVLTLDASGGLDAKAPAHEEGLYRGDAAIGMNLRLSSITHEDADRYLREFWNRIFPWIAVTKVGFAYDEAKGTMLVSMDGMATIDWARNGVVRDFNVGQSGIGSPNATFTRQPGPHQDAPYAVGYPSFSKTTVVINLPNKGEGFSLKGGADIDRVAAAVQFHRRSHIEGGVATIEISEKALAPEFPASEADAAAIALREMARADVVVRAVPIPAAGAAPSGVRLPAISTAIPTTAVGFAARGAQALQRGDVDYAIVDFDRAAQMEPKTEKWVYFRGIAHLAKGQNDLAMTDLNQALTMTPADPDALMFRAELFMRTGDKARANQDFDAVAKLAPDNMNYAMRRADAYTDAKLYDEAIGVLSQYIAGHPASPTLYPALNERCWFRAIRNQALDLALADCDAAVKLKPNYAEALDSRGFVQLRRGKPDAAIADYTAALAINPRIQQSLYGRGLAEARKGMTAQSTADIAAAKAISPKIADEFAGYGVTR